MNLSYPWTCRPTPQLNAEGRTRLVIRTLVMGMLLTIMPPVLAHAQGNDTDQNDTDQNDADSADAASPRIWMHPPDTGDAAIDFELIGEYVGQRAEDGATLALQLRNVGAGQFEAKQMVGGLPGQKGFDESSMIDLVGRRAGQTLVLSGGDAALFVTPSTCSLIDRDAKMIATLQRVQRTSPTEGAAPPEGAIVLFEGGDGDTNTRDLIDATVTNQGWLREGVVVQPLMQDFDLHLEFRIPHMPDERGQARGNSGIYLQSRYECQVLDSFATNRVLQGLGAIYRTRRPAINMAFPPLTWQTYDIRFTAARFNSDGSKRLPARVSVWLNGVLVQDDVAVDGPTGRGKDESATLLPIKLQNHGDPVRYRNVWVIDRGLRSEKEFPVFRSAESP